MLKIVSKMKYFKETLGCLSFFFFYIFFKDDVIFSLFPLCSCENETKQAYNLLPAFLSDSCF